ncbi:MAG TPA: nucleotide sugar dehydrogenase [Anaerolineae bacterium]|nr:nucleotide sugar dehydrogenase [Anaerolineae bacterium]HQH37349.1 nucleotide sugar dehydrogenase [Anaerolineae bacterium]
MSGSTLQQKIAAKTARMGVIGLGYVGLPVACLFAEAGFTVVGVDVKAERVQIINAGISPIEGREPGLAELLATVVATGQLRATTQYAALRDCDIVIVCVETPVDEQHTPRYVALQGALGDLGPVLKTGALVIVESTIAPGTMARVVKPLLEEASGKHANDGFYLGHCPERVMPGKLLANLRHMSRVCGGATPETAQAMVALYRHIVQADLDPADCVTAELVKTAENAYRDVNIAFANEVALVCEAVGGDVEKVRELVNKSPGRNMLLPGAGVGGHCIPKDPWLLVYQAQQMGVPLRLIPAARAVNEGMPLHLVALLEEALHEGGKAVAGARVLVLGYAYLEDSDDTRNSPSAVLVTRLHERGAEVVIHDPYVAGYQGDVYAMAEGCDAVVVMVAHSEYKTLDLTMLKGGLRTPILVDGRRVFAPAQTQQARLIYRRVGQR